MNPMVAQILVQDHQHELAAEAARVHLAATGTAAKGSASAGRTAATRRWISSLALHLTAVAR